MSTKHPAVPPATLPSSAWGGDAAHRTCPGCGVSVPFDGPCQGCLQKAQEGKLAFPPPAPAPQIIESGGDMFTEMAIEAERTEAIMRGENPPAISASVLAAREAAVRPQMRPSYPAQHPSAIPVAPVKYILFAGKSTVFDSERELARHVHAHEPQSAEVYRIRGTVEVLRYSLEIEPVILFHDEEKDVKEKPE